MPENFCPHCMADLAADYSFCPRCGRDVNGRVKPGQLPIGTVLHSPDGHAFLMGEVKGDGGFGLTYIAKELASGRVVAIKEYFPVLCGSQRGRDGSVQPDAMYTKTYERGKRNFISEASMLLALRELPSIVNVLDCFEANSTAYMVMEYLDGTTLRDLMQSQGHIEPDDLLRKALPLMRDMERMHKAGVLHRDIAPDNIMLMPDGSLKLLDFGCARSMEDGKSMSIALKFGFAPVEQYQTRGQGPFTDVYALCATLYYCLTGRVPVEPPERLVAFFDDGSDPLIPPTALGAAISREEEHLLLWGLAIQPADRPGSMGELANMLEAVLPDDPPPEPKEPHRREKPPRRRGGRERRNRRGCLGTLIYIVGFVVSSVVVRFIIAELLR